MGFSAIFVARILESVLRAAEWTTVPGVKAALYTGNPGTAGTANEVTGGSYARQTATFSANSGGACALTSNVSFTGMPACTVTHWGLWTTDTPAVYVGGGAVATSKAYTAGDTARLLAGTSFGLA
jgi:hypothetical protein